MGQIMSVWNEYAKNYEINRVVYRLKLIMTLLRLVYKNNPDVYQLKEDFN